MSNISQWSTSAASNNSAPPNGAPEGMAPSTVNDTIRENMAAVSRWFEDTQGGLVSAGAGNTYTITSNGSHAALADQSVIVFRADKTNTGAATLNVDSLGAKNIRASGANIAADEIVSGAIVMVAYNSNSDTYDLVNTISTAQLTSNLNLGTMSARNSVLDGDLSANVPLLDADNVFIADQRVSKVDPTFELYEVGAALDEKLWYQIATASDYVLTTRADDGSAGAVFLRASRTGTSVDSVNLTATSVQANGVDVHTASSQVDHDSTTGFVANEHIDHSVVSVAAGEGLSGGGTIAATRTIDLDIPSLTAISGSSIAATDSFLAYDASASAHREIPYKQAGFPVTGGSAAKIFTDDDVNKVHSLSGSTDRSFSLNTGVGETGNVIILHQAGTGSIQIDGTSTVNSASGLFTRTQFSVAILLCLSADVWTMFGDTSTA